METPPKPKLGQLLLENTSLSETQLNEALAIQKKDGGFLGQILIQKKMVLQHELMRALCAQLDLGWIDDLKPEEIDTKLIGEIPINYAKSHDVVPVKKRETPRGDILIVAVSDPFAERIRRIGVEKIK